MKYKIGDEVYTNYFMNSYHEDGAKEVLATIYDIQGSSVYLTIENPKTHSYSWAVGPSNIQPITLRAKISRDLLRGTG